MHIPQRNLPSRSSRCMQLAYSNAIDQNHLLTPDLQRSENNDFCSACRGNGFLLCCDGCDRSFHFTCLDPPISDEAKELNEPWYCYICVSKKPIAAESPEKKDSTGLFGPLLSKLKKANPKNFELPAYIKNFYDGTGADRNGSFMDAVSGKPTR